MNNLPEFYFTGQRMHGYYEPPGQAPVPQFFRGQDVEIQCPTANDQTKIDLEAWTVSAQVKASKVDPHPKWEGVVGQGIVRYGPNDYRIFIPGSITKDWRPGSYWLQVKAVELIGKNAPHPDRTTVLKLYPFNLKESLEDYPFPIGPATELPETEPFKYKLNG